MNPMTYLTLPDSLFGWIEWILFISQIVLLLVGGYFGFLFRDSNEVKVQALQRFGSVLLVLGATGALLGGLKLGVVAPFDTRLWLALITLFEIAFGIYAVIYSRTTYREQVSARRSTRPSPARKPVATATAATRRQTTNNASATTPRPVEVPVPRVAAGRREARRDRKRKKR